MMFHFEDDIRLHAGDGGEKVVEHLLGGHPEFPAARADFQPAFFVAEITFGEIPGAEQNEVAVVGEFHGKWIVDISPELKKFAQGEHDRGYHDEVTE